MSATRQFRVGLNGNVIDLDQLADIVLMPRSTVQPDKPGGIWMGRPRGIDRRRPA